MENKMKQMEELLRVRGVLKAIQQVSWSVSQFEKQFPMEYMQSEEEMKQAVVTYNNFLSEIKSCYTEKQG